MSDYRKIFTGSLFEKGAFESIKASALADVDAMLGKLGGPYSTYSAKLSYPTTPKSEYTGSLLPAVIYVSDLEIDLETASYATLVYQANALHAQTQSKERLASLLKTELEIKHKSKIDTLKSLFRELSDINNQLNNLSMGGSPPSPPQERQSTEFYAQHAREEDRKAHNDLVALKRSKGEARKLFKKLSSLCHPDKTGGDETLSEMFIAAKLAFEIEDVATLRSLVKSALSYKSGDAKLNRLKAIQKKKSAAKERMRAAQAYAQQFAATDSGQLLEAASTSKDAAEDLFLEMVLGSISDLTKQLDFYHKLGFKL